MDIDIGFWLTIFVVVGSVLWLLDWRLQISQARRLSAASAAAAAESEDLADLPDAASVDAAALKDAAESTRHPRILVELVEFSNSILPVVVIVLVVRSFLFEPFTIPSGSMLPTLQVHDFILVNKFAYGVRLPVGHARILDTGRPQRGEIMVFRYPEEPDKNYIKRVIGLPGDHIVIRNGRLMLNGEPVERQALSDRRYGNTRKAGYIEQIDDHRYTIQHTWRQHPYSGQWMSGAPEGEWYVPEDSYFVMGDNRDNSRDSRFWGFVPESHVAGKAVLIWMHWPSLLSLPDFSRNGRIDRVEHKKLSAMSHRGIK